MKKRLIFIALLPAMMRAQTLEECQQAAERNYPLVQQYDLISRTAELTVSNISKGWLPQLSATAQATLQSDVTAWPAQMQNMLSGMGINVKGLRRDQYRVGIDVQQTVYDGGAMRSQQEIARRQGDVETAQTETLLYQVRQRVNEMYFALLLLDEQIKLNRNLQELLASNEQKLAVMQKNGTAAESDYLTVKAERLNAAQQLTTLESSRQTVARLLSALCGIEVNAPLRPVPAVALPAPTIVPPAPPAPPSAPAASLSTPASLPSASSSLLPASPASPSAPASLPSAPSSLLPAPPASLSAPASLSSSSSSASSSFSVPYAALPAQPSLRPELKAINAQLSLTDARQRALDAALMPRLGLFAQGYYGYPGLNMFEDMMHHRWSLNGIIGARLTWNIGALYTRKADKAKLDAQRGAYEVQRNVFLFNNRLEQLQQRDDIERYRRLTADDEEIIRLRQSVRRAAESKLAHGIIDVNDLVREINAENNARVQQSVHEIEMLKEVYRLKYTLNE